MTQAKHIPGPWSIHNDADLSGEVFFNHANGKEYLIATAYSGNYDNSGHEREANARLIAAAPEMLKWLEVAFDMLSQCQRKVEFTLGACKNVSEIGNAITKAKGE